MDIYKILNTKPNSNHYLIRYINFIKNCIIKNTYYEGCLEKHHICPKAKDMFPQYASFIENPWNCAYLTPRQHFIAHMLLWKTYRNKSMTAAFKLMSNNFSIKSSKIFAILRNDYAILVSEQMKDTISVKTAEGISKRVSREYFEINDNIHGQTKGMTYAVDKNGKGHYVKKGDIRFSTGELKGNNAGTITITNGITNKRVPPDTIIPEGWYWGMTKNSTKGSTWINNGQSSKMHKEGPIPDGWVKGRIFSKKPKHVGTTGKICINDGNKNKMIDKNLPIPEGWVKGRLSIS